MLRRFEAVLLTAVRSPLSVRRWATHAKGSEPSGCALGVRPQHPPSRS